MTRKSLGSPNVSQKSTSTRERPQNNSQEKIKSSTGNSNDGGEKNPIKKAVEKAHTIHVFVKRKR